MWRKATLNRRAFFFFVVFIVENNQYINPIIATVNAKKGKEAMQMKQIAIQAKIEGIIDTLERGALVSTHDFLEVSNYEAVKHVLVQLCEEGKLKRVLRGIYQTPNYNAFLQKDIGTSPKKVAEKLAEKFGWTIAPAEDTALNELGLSTQVPAKYTFISDGPTKTYTLDNGLSIYFKHIANKEISNLTTKEAMVIEAIRTISQQHMNKQIRRKLSKTLSEQEIQHLLEQDKLIHQWIYEEIKVLKDEHDECRANASSSSSPFRCS